MRAVEGIAWFISNQIWEYMTGISLMDFSDSTCLPPQPFCSIYLADPHARVLLRDRPLTGGRRMPEARASPKTSLTSRFYQQTATTGCSGVSEGGCFGKLGIQSPMYNIYTRHHKNKSWMSPSVIPP